MKPLSRRTLLACGTTLGSALAAGPLLSAAQEARPEPALGSRPARKVIVTGGHPGDPEYGCGGTVARYTDLGHDVILLYLNRGDTAEQPGAADASGVRVLEARKACGILKARPLYAG